MVEKITPADLEGLVKSAEYKHIEGTTLTICILTLHSGFNLVGESACLNPADFDAELGKQIAYKNAFEQLWKLEGYARAQAAIPTTAKGRVEAERDQVLERLAALCKLRRSGQPSCISDEQWELLGKQAAAMKEYLSILEQRLATWVV